MTPQDKQRLLARIEQLTAELDQALAASESAGATVELDQTRQGRLSRMDALQGQAMAKAAAQRSRLQLQRLAAARARMDHEDFGYCAECDEEIALARLQLDPSVRLCIRCAGAREQSRP